jgi:outer membrane protein assembly factor BamA
MRSRSRFEFGLLVVLLLLPSAGGADDLLAEDELDAAYEQDFDPWEGIDRDGRVPKVELPADLPNPERWRYIPAGRIKPGNFFQRFLVSSFVSPIVFRQEDVGWGFGVAAADADFRRQRRQEFASIFASYTTEGQQSYGVTWRRWLEHINLPEGGVLQEERNFVSLRGGWSRTLTRRFYGIGPDSDRGEQTRYTDARGVVQAGIQRTWPEAGSDFVWALGMRGEFHKLDGGKGDEPDTEDVFPSLFGRAEQTNLGFLNASVAWDTRDSQANAYRGWEVAAAVSAPLLQTDWDVAGIFELRGSYVQPVWPIFHNGGDPGEDNPPTDVIAIRARIEQMTGSVPFYALPALGGSDDLRGFVGGRFRDRSLWVAGLEWRFWVIPRGFRIPFTEAIRVERVGLAPFFEAGSVADHVGRFADTKVRLSYGFSLLVALERAVPFRFNFGWSEEDFILSAGFGLDF